MMLYAVPIKCASLLKETLSVYLHFLFGLPAYSLPADFIGAASGHDMVLHLALKHAANKGRGTPQLLVEVEGKGTEGYTIYFISVASKRQLKQDMYHILVKNKVTFK